MRTHPFSTRLVVLAMLATPGIACGACNQLNSRPEPSEMVPTPLAASDTGVPAPPPVDAAVDVLPPPPLWDAGPPTVIQWDAALIPPPPRPPGPDGSGFL